MPSEYTSIKEDVLHKLNDIYPDLRDRFGIDIIGIFGSVARGEDTIDSDIDVLYKFQDGKTPGMVKYMDLIYYLEDLLGRKIDFVPLEFMKPRFRAYVEPDMIIFNGSGAKASV